jgi:hypothetical protein
MLVFIIPFILILIAPILQWKLSLRRIKDKISLPLSVIFLLSILLAAGLAALAFIISLYGFLPTDIKCATGYTVFISFGLINICLVIPVIGIITTIRYYNVHK